MEIIISVAAFFLLIGIIITIHEGGHFMIGKWCGIRMLEFSIGFGPKIFQKKIGKDQTLFTLRLLPLGGFVKPLDQSSVKTEEWNNLSESEKARSFANAKRWKKTLMVAGGPFSNFVLAFIVYFLAMTVVGTKGIEPIISEVVPNSVFANAGIKEGDKIEEVNGNKVKVLGDAYSMLVNGMIQGHKTIVKTNREDNIILDFSQVDLKNMSQDIGETLGVYFTGNIGDVTVKKVNEGSPAEKAGIKENDKLISVNNKEFKNIDRAVSFINKHPGEQLSLQVQRDGKTINLNVIPKLEKDGNKEIRRIGVQFQLENIKDVKTIHYTVNEALWNSTQKVWDSTYTTLISIKKLVLGQLSTKSISGPVAIADYSGKSAQHGLFQYMLMIAAISIAVGVFNLMPIPALDGGHLAQYAIEWVIGKDLNPKILHYSQIIGFGFIMGVFAMSMCNDIFKYFL